MKNKKEDYLCEIYDYLSINDGYIVFDKPIRLSIVDDDNNKKRRLSIRSVVVKLDYFGRDENDEPIPYLDVYMIDSNFNCWCVADYCSDDQIEELLNACKEQLNKS